MFEIFMAGFLQFLFQMSRTFSTRLISRDHIIGTMLMTFVIQALWLVTTAIGVKAVFEVNWYIISSYMFGGLVGAYFAMKITLKK